MAINPNISLGVRTPQFQDPLETVARVSQVRNLMRQPEIQAAQLERMRAETKQTELENELFPDKQAALKAQAEAAARKKQLDEEESALKQAKERSAMFGQIVGRIASEEDSVREVTDAVRGKLIGGDQATAILNMPWPQRQQYFQRFREGLLDADKQLDLEIKRRADARAETKAAQDTKKADLDIMKGTMELEGTLPKGPTADIQNYEFARKGGYKGTFEEWQNLPKAEQERHNRAMEALTARGQNMTDSRARDAKEDKPPTAAERRTMTFYERAKNASDLLDGMEVEMASKGLFGQVWYNFAPNWVQSTDNQKYRQAQRAFTEARLRKDSGATIKESEYESDAQTYFPQPGDTKETLAQKKQGREAILRGLHQEAGRAARELEAPAPGGGPKVGTVEDGYRFKGGDPSKPENWEKVK